ncbi:MAG: FlgT C-terminal domain-containing protein [Acidobacteriota bacterium]|nr:FlgT C-terminal domain-containing protein [Acidobacteriota bacterium]
MGTVFEQEVVMRHPLAALTAGILLAATSALLAADGTRPTLSREAAPAPVTLIEKVGQAPRVVSGPLPIGVESDVYCSGYLGDVEGVFPGEIVSAEKDKSQTLFMLGDILYINLGERDGLVAGMEFSVLRPRQVVNKWGSITDVVGRLYGTPGRIRVICVQERSAIVEISYSCVDVQIGDSIMPFEPIPVPLARRTQFATICDTPNGKATGHIVVTRLGETPIGTDSVVYLDLGEADGLNPGDFLTVFRASGRAEGVRTILGEASILTTRDRTSVAIVTLMTDTIYVGDSVELK